MPKDDMETQCMNELFGGNSKRRTDDDDLPYYNHWRPVAIVHPDGEKIRDLTREEQLKWLKQQKERER
jgi:hypothetical protein